MSMLTSSAQAEALRLRKWPALWVLLSAWMILNLLFLYVFNYITYRTGDPTGPAESGIPREAVLAGLLPAAVPAVFTQGMAMFGGAMMLILGALTIGSGYGWGTWKTVFTQGPSRASVFRGTLAMLSVVVVGLVLTVFVVDLSVASIIATMQSQAIALPTVADSVRSIGAAVLILGMWMLAGVLIGALARGPALAVGLGLVWVLVVENLLRGVAGVLGPLRPLTDFMPGTAAGSLAGALRTVAGPPPPGVLTTTAVLTLLGYLVVFALATGVLLHRRDMA